MTTTIPSHGDAFHYPNATTTSNGDAPPPASCLHSEWMPLHEIAQTWAAFGAEASNPAAFQATGTAFLALAFEASALWHYISSDARSSHERGSAPSSAYTQGIEHVLADLSEAAQQWKSVLLWLDFIAREPWQQAEISASLVHAQQQRVLSLILRVQQEYLDAHHEPLLISLGYLRAPAPAVAEKAGQP